MISPTHQRITLIWSAVAACGRAAARRWHCDPDEGAGIALLALCDLAGRYTGPEDGWAGYALLTARRAVSRACRGERRRVAGRVFPDLDRIPAPPDVPAEVDSVRGVAAAALADLGIVGALAGAVLLDGLTVDETAARYAVTVRAVRRSVQVACDTLRARFDV